MNNRQPKFNEEELLAFAKSYLSEAFPNPHRIGCPPISELACMAEHRDAKQSTSDHLSRCSPCFKEYMEILAHIRGMGLQKPYFCWRGFGRQCSVGEYDHFALLTAARPLSAFADSYWQTWQMDSH